MVWVSVSGIARVSRDRQKIHELYVPDWKAWFAEEGDPRRGEALTLQSVSPVGGILNAAPLACRASCRRHSGCSRRGSSPAS